MSNGVSLLAFLTSTRALARSRSLTMGAELFLHAKRRGGSELPQNLLTSAPNWRSMATALRSMGLLAQASCRAVIDKTQQEKSLSSPLSKRNLAELWALLINAKWSKLVL